MPYHAPAQLPLRLSSNTAAATLLVALLLLAFALLGSRRRSRSSVARTFLLIGPMGSGKTVLWSKLVLGARPATFTSVAENEGHVTARMHLATKEDLDARDNAAWPPAHLRVSPPLHLLDIPGHTRLRARKLALSLSAAEGIVLTTTTDLRSTREAADHLLLLFALLSLRQLRNPKAKMPRLLIYITKMDSLPSSTTPERAVSRVQNALEREFERRKADAAVASSAKLDSLEAPVASGSLANLFTKGSAAQELPVDEVELLNSEVAAEVPDWETLGVRVSWASGSCITPGGLDTLWEWLDV